MLISLLIIPFCKAADPDQSWNQAVQHIPNWQQEEVLRLYNNQIVAIPDNFEAPNLQWLLLNKNQIDEINPERLLEQFPHLVYLNLSNNPLHPADIRRLRDLAQEAGRDIQITADNILPEGHGIKKAVSRR